MKDINFMALDGGDCISANTYFLKLGKANILLDCGSSGTANNFHGASLYPLYETGLISSPLDISQIYISHAHMDHMGYLPQMLADAKNATAFMTSVSKLLTHYQLLENVNNSCDLNTDVASKVAVTDMLEKICTVNYLDQKYFPEHKVAFFKAGHIPGAMMTLFQYKGQKILYTGDYSFDDTPLTRSCMLPDNLKVDTLIICGTHAKHPWYRNKDNALRQKVEEIFGMIRSRKNVFCRINQLSKGIELLAMLNRYKKQFHLDFPIYLDNSMMGVIGKLEKAGHPVLENGNFLINNGKKPVPHLTIAMSRYIIPDFDENVLNVDFALHDDFEEMRTFIKQLNPKTAVVVHSAPKKNPDDQTIQDTLLWDPDCRTQFIFPEKGQLYKI